MSSPPYLPFLDGHRGTEFRWRLGVRPLDLVNWIEWGPDAEAALAYKTELNDRHPDTVFAVLEDVVPEATEIAEAIATHVDGELCSDLHPLDAAARLVPEDLVMMVEREGCLVFGGGSVCFPNRWDLRSKLGSTMAEVHAPVALLNAQLEGPVDRFFERLRPERSFWRLGWGILDTGDWYTPLDGTASPRPPDPMPDELYLRVERETLRRFPRTNAVLFTIRTYVTPLDAAVATPAGRAQLADALDNMPSDVRAYKDLAETTDRIVTHLRVSSPPH